MNRLCFLSPDVDQARAVVRQLKADGIEERNIYVLANGDAEIEDLPDAASEADDFLPAFARGIGIGGLAGLFLGVAALVFRSTSLIVGGVLLRVSTDTHEPSGSISFSLLFVTRAPPMELALRISRYHLRLLSLPVLLVAATLLSGCAATRPDIRTDYDRSADFSAYQTYGFPDELGTDRAGYSTLITTHFRQAVEHEMQSRGYRYTEDDPDLLVNFFANVRHVTTVRSRPRVWVSYGYYGYRYGMYSAWPLYADDVDTVHYRVGTANIDIVDAERNQLVWEGVAEGRLTREVMENPQPAIESVVAELFSRYPGRPPGSVSD